MEFARVCTYSFIKYNLGFPLIMLCNKSELANMMTFGDFGPQIIHRFGGKKNCTSEYCTS